MTRHELITLAEAFISMATAHQLQREKVSHAEAEALNLTLRGQIMRDCAAVLRNASDHIERPTPNCGPR